MNSKNRYNRRVSIHEFLNVLKTEFTGKPCWGFHKYLGSMLLFDFGEVLLSYAYSIKKNVEAGEYMLKIRNCYWDAIESSCMYFDSDTISPEKVEALRDFFLKEELVDFLMFKKDKLEFIFSNNKKLSVDLTDKYDAQESIIEIVTSNGRVYQISCKGYVYLLTEPYTDRTPAKILNE